MDPIFDETTVPNHEVDRSFLPIWLRWNRTSPQLLADAEAKLLQRLKSSLNLFFVPIFENTCSIRTMIARNYRSSSAPKEPIPLVLLHGFASGLGLWCKNIDSLAANRPVYAFDLLGFGRSSRPPFPKDAAETEALWVKSIEEWRSSVNLDKFILVGHSLGGYLSTSYAIQYPYRVAHLILADPWGFNECPIDEETQQQLSNRPWLIRAIKQVFRFPNPLSALRAIGPLGRSVVHRIRGDLRSVFDQRYLVSGDYFEVPMAEEEPLARHSFTDSDQPPTEFITSSSNGVICSRKPLSADDFDGAIALDYVYHVNVQTPSGEAGFKSLCTHIAWSRRPMLDRIDMLDRTVPITFIFGSRSWMDMSSGTKTKARRTDAYVDIKIIEGAGHQAYAQMADEFNDYVNSLAQRVDSGYPFRPADRKLTARSDLPSESDQFILEDRTRRRRSLLTSGSRPQSHVLANHPVHEPVRDYHEGATDDT